MTVGSAQQKRWPNVGGPIKLERFLKGKRFLTGDYLSRPSPLRARVVMDKVGS